eukprot:m.53383 g.53383  ORF g.53383 m.53383 type:complete len:410 (-) comp13158_c0_seq1:74-1303(-)
MADADGQHADGAAVGKAAAEAAVAGTAVNADVDDAATEDRKRPRFGNRMLTDSDRVFEHNAWDNVGWDEEQERHAQEVVRKQALGRVDDSKQENLEAEADKFWDKFYSNHQNKFFKDRHWLLTEFPDLAPENPEYLVLPPPRGEGAADDEDEEADTGAQRASASKSASKTVLPAQASDAASSSSAVAGAQSVGGGGSSSSGEASSVPLIQHSAHSTKRCLEVGCGVGNTVFPLLTANRDPGLFVYACDFAPTAVNVLKTHAQYEPKRCHAFVCDVANEDVPLPEGSLDVAIMIFVLSAIHPDKMAGAIARVVRCLKPGGVLLLRDYGRYDLAQLRFKEGRYLSENFYMRGDGTRVYFFTQEELRDLLQRCGLTEEENIIDRRLIINRIRRLKMNRIWIQCKFRKPLAAA